MKNCGVYMVVNPLNQVYIGASKNLKNRTKCYTSMNNPLCDRPISMSIKKYGKDAHTVTILEECPPRKLSETEKFYINYFKYLGFDMLNLMHVKKRHLRSAKETLQTKMLLLKIGNSVYKERQKMGLGLHEAAKKAGVKYVRLKAIENSTGQLIDISDYFKVLDFFGLELKFKSKAIKPN